MSLYNYFQLVKVLPSPKGPFVSSHQSCCHQ